jgi:hypothetical protein
MASVIGRRSNTSMYWFRRLDGSIALSRNVLGFRDDGTGRVFTYL